MSQEQDQIFFRNYSLVIGILTVALVIFFFLARIIGTSDEAYAKEREPTVAEETKPVGQVKIEGEEEEEAEMVAAVDDTATGGGDSGDTGKQVYSGLCFSCHGTGLPGIPQLGDTAGWSDRIAQGNELLYERAINGYMGTNSGMMMPPKGGNPALSDEEVKAAVDYMVANSQ